MALAGALLQCAAFAETEDQPERPGAADPRRGQLVRVVFHDGQSLRGRFVSQTADAIAIELVSGGQLSIPSALVHAVEEERTTLTTERRELWFDDANRTRYLYGPSAMMLRRGEAYFSQKELLISEFGYGVTDHLSVVVGALPVLWFIRDGTGLNATAGLKAGGSLSELVHVGGGAQFIVLPNLSGGGPLLGGFAFVTGTWGRSDRHLSLSVAIPVTFAPGENPSFPAFIGTASGNLRLGKNVALVSENWVVVPSRSTTAPPNFILADGAAVRFMGERFSVDVGAILFSSPRGLELGGIPLPWLDFTYHFELGPN
jgi:hypothetical protein